MPAGGYQRPSSPAPVSPPGALSQRTDGGPGDKRALTGGGKYGATKELEELQSGAPIQAPGGPDPEALASEGSPFIGLLGEGTSRPDEPVTAGASAGPGPGEEALGIPNEDAADAQALIAWLPALEHMANRRGFASTRAMIRKIKSLI